MAVRGVSVRGCGTVSEGVSGGGVALSVRGCGSGSEGVSGGGVAMLVRGCGSLRDWLEHTLSHWFHRERWGRV